MRNYFTIYGFDGNKKDTIKLSKDISNAVFQNNKIVEKINITDECKKYLKTGKNSVYFSKQMCKDKKYGMVILSDKLKPNSSKLNSIITYVFGYNIDIEKAKELMDKEFNINRTEEENKQNNVVTGAKIQDGRLYLIASNYKKHNDDFNKNQKKIKMIEDILSTCDNGEVFTKGDRRYCVLKGIEASGYGVDTEKLKKNPALYAQFAKEGKPPITITVEDEIKKVKSTSLNYNRNNFTNSQLFDMASQYELLNILQANEKTTVEKLKKQILNNFKEGSTTIVSLTGDELVVNIKKALKGKITIDAQKLKLDKALWQQYSKPKKDMEHFSVVQLS